MNTPENQITETLEKTPLSPKGAEQLLLEELARFQGASVYCTSLGRAQFAAAFAREHSQANVLCNFLDCYLQQQALKLNTQVSNLNITCTSDIPSQPFDLVVLPSFMSGDGELLREQLQDAYDQLALNGLLVTATDNPTDSWLHTLMQLMCDKVTCCKHANGIVYLGKKLHPLKKRKHYTAEFSFRHAEQLYSLITRPGVFSHRRLDLGARALMEVMQLTATDSVLEIGCGSGAVSFVAAQHAAMVTAIDSNPRAIQCTDLGAKKNGLTNVQTQLCANACELTAESYTVVLANPPYYSQRGIADIFLQGARHVLQPNGKLYLVTKQIHWFEEMLPNYFGNVKMVDTRGYRIYEASAKLEC
jgi:16S rRNA G1207 methylase RsmC